jgi:HK97 family phage major capsid protein
MSEMLDLLKRIDEGLTDLKSRVDEIEKSVGQDPAEVSPDQRKEIAEAEAKIADLEKRLRELEDLPARKTTLPPTSKIDGSGLLLMSRQAIKAAPYAVKAAYYDAMGITQGGGAEFTPEVKTFIDSLRHALPMQQVKSMLEGDASGGPLVPPQIVIETTRYTTEMSIVRPRATIQLCAGNIFRLTKLKQGTYDPENPETFLFGGVEVNWVGEAERIDESQPEFEDIELSMKKVAGLVSFSSELLEDTPINLVQYLTELFGEAIAFAEDRAFLTGNGVKRPLGIVHALQESEVNNVPREAANQVSYEDLIALEDAVPASLGRNAVYLIGPRVRPFVKSLRDDDGRPLWAPSISQAEPPTLNGYPVYATDKLSPLGTPGDVVFGDLRYYKIGDKPAGGLRVASSQELYFTTDKLAIRFTKRVDGMPIIDEAFAILV